MSTESLAHRATQEEVHHAAPRCLLRLHDEATNGDLDGAGIEAWLEWEWEATRWGVPVEIAREDLERMVERPAVVLDRNTHRLIHESDWQRWGRRGGNATLRRYGTSWFSALALVRWGRLEAEDLDRARVVSHGLPVKDDGPHACIDGTVYLTIEEDGQEIVEAVPCKRCRGEGS